MKKHLFILGILLFTFTSCEDDDFCSEPTTPRLIIGFYDIESPSDKKALTIYSWAEGKDSIYQLATVDSILLPLDTQHTSTKYKISSSTIVDEFNFTYTVTDKYISESCGHIGIFNDFNLESYTEQWIQGIEVTIRQIEDETETHVKIYH